MIIKITKWLLAGLGLLAASLTLFLLSQPSMDDLGVPYHDEASADDTDSPVTIRWFGVSTLLIDDGETQIMSDGFFSRPGMLDVLLERPLVSDPEFISQQLATLNINRLAAIMPVHSHYDHAMDTGNVAKLSGAQILGSPTTANLAKSAGVNPNQITVVNTHTPYQFGKFTITFYPSAHAPLASNEKISGMVNTVIELPAPYTAYKEGKSYAVHVAHPSGSLIIQGSAGFEPGSLAGVKSDLVFLGAGGLNMLPAEHRLKYVNEIVTQTQAKKVILVHHDNMFHKFGEIKLGMPFVNVDKDIALELKRWVSPAQLYQMKFSQAISF